MKLKKMLAAALAAGLLLTTACQKAPHEQPSTTPTTEPTPTQGLVIDETAAQLTMDLSKKEQEMDGFGAGFTWYSDYIERNGSQAAEEVYDLLFNDAALSILRFKNDYDYASFEQSAQTNATIYEAAKKRAEARGEDITVLYTSWSPAGYLKNTGVESGEGTLRRNENGEYDYAGFAQWWLESVEAYRSYGIDVDVISIQNECDFIASYESCEFDKTETSKNACYSDAYLATYRLLKEKLGDKLPLMIGPETMTVAAIDLKMYVKKILEEEPGSMYALAHHLYLGGNSTDDPPYCDYDSFLMNFMDNKSFIQTNKMKAWQTEFYRGTALQTANVINNSMIYENASAYIYWGGVWATDATGTIYDSHMISIGRGISNWPKGATNGYLVTGDYYAVRHFSEFVRPGYYRIQAGISSEGDVRCSMYASPDESRLVLVVINNSENEEILQLPLENYSMEASQIYQSILADGYTADMLYQNKGALDSSNKTTLPGKSVTTIVIDGSAK